MFLIKLILKLAALPILLLLYIIRGIVGIIASLGSIVTTILGVIMFFGTIIAFWGGNVGLGIFGIFATIFFFAAPYILVFLVELLASIVEGIISFLTD